MRVSARAIGYVVVMAVLFVAVAWLLTKMARTEAGDRRLILIGAALTGGAVMAMIGLLRLRSGRDR